jgi:hypothetical protein
VGGSDDDDDDDDDEEDHCADSIFIAKPILSTP